MDDATGSDLRSNSRRLQPFSISSVATFSGDAYASSISTVDATATGAGTERRDGTVSNTSGLVIPSLVVHACRARFASCSENIERAIDNSDNLPLRANAMSHVENSLKDLWATRNRREPAFAELINMLQSIFLDRTLEDFTDSQLIELQEVFDKCKQERDYSDDFVNDLTIQLARGGLDVLRELE